MIVAAGVLVENGRVLLAQRKPDAHLGGAWELPGGKVEEGEDPRDALRRELAEELGIDVTVGEVVDVTFHWYEQAGKNILLLFFDVTRVPGSPDPRAIDVAAFEWSDAAGLDPARFPAGDVAVVAKLRARLEMPACPRAP